MTAPLREQHVNGGSTTLNGAINNSVTSITVTTGSVFPSTGNFRVMVDSEIMICTARSTNTLTVTRGQDGTSAASHSDLATICMVYTSQGFARLMQDNDPLWGYSSAKPLSQLFDDDGSTILTASSFTWQNQGGASVTDENGTVRMSVPTDAGTDLRVQERTAPSTPYTYIAAMSFGIFATDSGCTPSFGMGFRETSSGKAIFIHCFVNNTSPGWPMKVAVTRYSSLTAFSADSRGPKGLMLLGSDGIVWFKIENDGTNLKYYISGDGWTWIQVFSEGKAAYFSSGPDRVFWFGSNKDNSASPATAATVRLHHWSKGE